VNGQYQPICQLIANRILLDIIKHDALQLGERLPTIASLVKRYSVSTTTISAALAQLEQDGWVRVIPGSGSYIQRVYMQHVICGNRCLGLILPIVDRELTLRVFQGVEAEANRNGWQLTLAESHQSYEQERVELQRMFDAGCEAVVISAVPRTHEQSEHDYLAYEFTDRAIVMIDCATVSQKRPQVIFDNYGLGFDMASLLIKNGRDRIAFMVSDDLGNKYSNPVVHGRMAGVRDAVKYACLSDDHLMVCHTHYLLETEGPSVANYFHQWKQDVHRANAIITLNDQPAMNVISVALQMGIDVPNDLVVFGHDNLMAARNFNPPFSTSNPDFPLLGATAARHAMGRATGAVQHPTVVMIPVGIVTRGSILNVG
jgi:DNA-binding LacI/PurR family transcriptional regulator